MNYSASSESGLLLSLPKKRAGREEGRKQAGKGVKAGQSLTAAAPGPGAEQQCRRATAASSCPCTESVPLPADAPLLEKSLTP